jgi:hypothetical protein
MNSREAMDILTAHIPEVVNQMPRNEVFNSYDFIRRFTHRNQADYVRALCAYVEQDNQTPFQAVHGHLMKALRESGLVQIGDELVSSRDMFGHPQRVPTWQRI